VNDIIQPKRWFLGKKLANENLEGQLLPKFIALPIFSSDALSSVAYGPQELLMILTMGGVGLLGAAPGIAAVEKYMGPASGHHPGAIPSIHA
jgi:hypothetical protein